MSHDDPLAGAIRAELRRSTPTDPCPSSEDLAAYVEGHGPADERRRHQAHFASCARCQAILAGLVESATATELAPAATGEIAAARPTPGRRSWVWTVVPAAAAAVVVITAWIATREPGGIGGTLDPAAVTTPVARNEAAPPPASPAPPATAESVPVEPQPKLAAPQAKATIPQADRRAAEPAGPGATGSRLESIDSVAAAPPPRDPRPAEQMAVSEAIASARPAAPLVRDEALRQEAARERSSPGVETEVFGPEERARWRLGPSGAISHSPDAGQSWIQQTSGTTADLKAGSCPSPMVCWVVGASGTVLVTLDAGRLWTPVTPPAPVDFVGVEASSPDRATVQAADGRRYATADRGRTWLSR